MSDDLHNIALLILRNNGANDWQKLVNVCKSMNKSLSPIYIGSNGQYKCGFYIDNYYFTDYGVGKTIRESSCDAVRRFLNRYTNIRKICCTNNYSNPDDVYIKKCPETEMKTKLDDTLVENSKEQKELLVKIANLCTQQYTDDFWSTLHKICQLTKIHFVPKFENVDDKFCCTFLFNGLQSPGCAVANTRVNSGRALAEKFVKLYASNYEESLKIFDNILIAIASKCRAVRQNEYMKIIKYMEDYLQIPISFESNFCQLSNLHSCQLLLRDQPCLVIAESTTELEAKYSAIENFFVKYFQSQSYGKLHIDKLFNRIAKFCKFNEFSDEWKTLYNACKLLGLKFQDRFAKEGDLFVCTFSIENHSPDITSAQETREKAANCVAKQFIEKYCDLKQLIREQICNLNEKDLFHFVATICVDLFWSNNWEVLSNVCTERGVTLIKHCQEDCLKFRCTMSIGIHHYDTYVELSDQVSAFNILAQHFFYNYGRKTVSKEAVITLSKPKFFEINQETVFKEIANYCKDHSMSDSWKTFCNACKTLKYKMFEKFTSLENKEYICESFIEDKNTNLKGTGLTHKESAISLAKQFIEKYQCENNIELERDKVFKEIASFCKRNPNSNHWKALNNACIVLKYRMFEKFTCVENNTYLCEFYIEDFGNDLKGQAYTRREAAISVAKQFIEKYTNENVIEHIGSSTSKDSDMELQEPHHMDDKEIFKKIAQICKSSTSLNKWKIFRNSFKEFKLNFNARFFPFENEIGCFFSIEEKSLYLTGRGCTKNIAANCLIDKFTKKYFVDKIEEKQIIKKEIQNQSMKNEKKSVHSLINLEVNSKLESYQGVYFLMY